MNQARLRLALYQPDIAGNLGTILRLCACFNVDVDIIEPCGFAFSDRALKRSAMDYEQLARFIRHADWESFIKIRAGRTILASTSGGIPLHQAVFETNDTILMGSESSGAPDYVHQYADQIVCIPMQKGFRWLNVAVSAGIILAEALRQTGGFSEC